METASQPKKISLFPGPGVFLRFFSAGWWRHTLKFAWAFKKHLYLPAILSTVASLMLTSALVIMPTSAPGVAVEAAVYLPPLFLAGGLVIVSGTISLVAMILGVMRLAAFCRTYLRCPVGASNEEMLASQAEAIDQVGHHKGHLVKVWLVATIIAIPLLFMLAAAAMVALFMSPEMIALFKLGSDGALVRNFAMLATVVLYVIISNYSITTLAASVLVDRDLGATTRIALLLALTASPGLTVITIVDMLLYTLICTPNAIFQSMDLKAASGMALSKPGLLDFILDIWQGASSLIVFPVTAALLLELLRDALALGEEL
jgi:hypothetical protein